MGAEGAALPCRDLGTVGGGQAENRLAAPGKQRSHIREGSRVLRVGKDGPLDFTVIMPRPGKLPQGLGPGWHSPEPSWSVLRLSSFNLSLNLFLNHLQDLEMG